MPTRARGRDSITVWWFHVDTPQPKDAHGPEDRGPGHPAAVGEATSPILWGPVNLAPESVEQLVKPYFRVFRGESAQVS